MSDIDTIVKRCMKGQCSHPKSNLSLCCYRAKIEEMKWEYENVCKFTNGYEAENARLREELAAAEGQAEKFAKGMKNLRVELKDAESLRAKLAAVKDRALNDRDLYPCCGRTEAEVHDGENCLVRTLRSENSRLILTVGDHVTARSELREELAAANLKVRFCEDNDAGVIATLRAKLAAMEKEMGDSWNCHECGMNHPWPSGPCPDNATPSPRPTEGKCLGCDNTRTVKTLTTTEFCPECRPEPKAEEKHYHGGEACSGPCRTEPGEKKGEGGR